MSFHNRITFLILGICLMLSAITSCALADAFIEGYNDPKRELLTDSGINNSNVNSATDITVQQPEIEVDTGTTQPETTENITTSATPETILPPETSSQEPEVPSTFSIHFIDVGQADAALVECDGKYMLIDGGNKADSSKIYTILKNINVQKIDIVVATHVQEDHIGGIAGAYNYAKADLTLCPTTSYDSEPFNDFKKYADSKGGGITVPKVGDTYQLGSATIRILGVNSTYEVNDTSIVLMITYGNTKFLFTGDAERDTEQKILNSGTELSADVLKVAHHGSANSTTYPFLREIMPDYAIISVGEGNSYEHPTDATLSRLRDADVSVYRTDLQGDIYCTSDGNTVNITVTKNADTDTLVAPGPITTEAKPSETTTPATSIGCDYIGNKNTKKFHYPNCSSVSQMKDKNKYYYTGNREGIISECYKPCANCNP